MNSEFSRVVDALPGPQGVDKLFEPFYTTKSGGMGIRLSVSRPIIESHRGCLWASPNEGPGATFSLSIPCGPVALTSNEGNGAARMHAVTDAVASKRTR